MSAPIHVEGLTKTFGTFTAVDNVAFRAEAGTITALLGPSGSGKSTVLRIIAGLESPDAGRVVIGSEELTSKSVQERRVGFVFQHYALFRHMSVRENVAFGLKVRKESKPSVQKRVDELLRLVQLAPFADRYPHQLSGGQRQRVALARALAPRPQVLLLDEPFGALDARVRQDLRRWLDELHRELGVTSLLVTHDQEEALELAQRVVVMHEGRVEQIGSADEIYNRPATPFIAGFVGAANVLRGVVIDGNVQFGESFVAGADDFGDGVVSEAYVRPHDVQVSRTQNGPLSTAATVARLSNLGWVTKLQLKLDDGQMLFAELPNHAITGITTGDRVFIDLGRAKVFAPQAVRSDELAAF